MNELKSFIFLALFNLVSSEKWKLIKIIKQDKNMIFLYSFNLSSLFFNSFLINDFIFSILELFNLFTKLFLNNIIIIFKKRYSLLLFFSAK